MTEHMIPYLYAIDICGKENHVSKSWYFSALLRQQIGSLYEKVSCQVLLTVKYHYVRIKHRSSFSYKCKYHDVFSAVKMRFVFEQILKRNYIIF